MELEGEGKLLRIFIGEGDTLNHLALSEVIIKAARDAGMAGATAWRGTMSFGATSRIRSAKVLDLAADLPLIIEIVDTEPRINDFVPRLNALIEAAGCGGLVTLEKVHIIKYRPGAA